MFCSSCGKKIKEGASFCEKCGKPVPKITTKVKINGLGLAGFICSLAGIITCGITSIVGFVISLISFILNKQKGNKDRYSLAGLIISSITILLIIIFYAIMLFTAKTVKVCDFSVKTYDEAVKYCKKSTLNCYVSKEHSKTIPAGEFINQDVPAGKKVKSYYTVNVKYSKGVEKKSSSNVTSHSKKKEKKTRVKKPQKKKEKFSYTIDKSYVGDYNMGYYIEGTVNNNENKDYSYVQIEFVCYDSGGNNIGTALDNTNNLLANQTWKYKAMLIETDADKVDHCDYHKVTGY